MTDVLPPHVLAEMITGKPPRRDTFEGWQHYRTTRGQFAAAPKLTFAQWRALTPHRRSLYDLHRTAMHVNLPLQETPMSLKVSRLVNRRMRNNALKQKPATRAGVMVTGWGYQGKTETVCEVAAGFEDAWLDMHNHLKRGMLTAGGMPEYLMRRTGGVVGLLERLIEDGAQEAMDSGKELLDEGLLDEIVISLDDPGRDPGAGEVPPVPGATRQPRKKTAGTARQKGGRSSRNTVFDDRGPRSAARG